MIVSVINCWVIPVIAKGFPVYASRDWHQNGHLNFKEGGGLWPPPSSYDSDGAKFHLDLALSSSTIIVTKGVRLDQDHNSVFDQRGLAFQLHKDVIQRLWIAGLAEDVCR